MTRKDYQLIANAINAANPDGPTRVRLVEAFADRLGMDNPAFNSATFAAACKCKAELPAMSIVE